jgi:ferritin-like metal-binding protein YciE
VSSYEQKIVQYLEEAHATEVALIRVQQSQIAMTPRGSTRTAIEEHLEETRGHAERVRDRINALQTRTRGNPLQAWMGLTEAVVGQALALGKAPLDLVRGASGEEKVLKNAKDDCATEALEIATYTAIERLASAHGDRETAQLATDILADERRMLDRLLNEEIPKLTDAVARAEIQGRPSFDAATTGVADAARSAAGAAGETAAKTTRRATRAAAGGRSRSASGGSSSRSRSRTASGSSSRSGSSRGSRGSAAAAAAEAPIAGYDDLNATELIQRLSGLSQEQLAAVAAYERAHDDRSTVLERVDALTEDQPWAGYDDQDVEQVRAALRDADEDTVRRVREYERRHKDRTGVLEATERAAATS